jgi:Flp pilus assembly protein TadD
MARHLERTRPPGRNDPCPCGSGKKYKRCCLSLEEARTPHRGFDTVVGELALLDAQGDTEAALSLVEDARLTLRDSDLDALLVERYRSSLPDHAENALRAWWEREHDRYSGTGLAGILVDQERVCEALEILNASDSAEAPPEYWRLLGVLRAQQGDPEGAIGPLENYMRLAPEDGQAWLTLAAMLRTLGRHERASQALRRAGDALPEALLPRLWRLEILAEQEHWREVRDLAEMLLAGAYADATSERNDTLRMLLARACLHEGNADRARSIWIELLERHPEQDELRFRIASLELQTGRHRQTLRVLEAHSTADDQLDVLDLRFRALLTLHEFGEARGVAERMESIDPCLRLLPLIQAIEAASYREYVWALELLAGEPPHDYRDLWCNLRLDCTARLGQWQEVLPALKACGRPDEHVLARAILGSMAAGKLDLADRLLDEIRDADNAEAQSLAALMVPLRQARRVSDERRQNQIDAAEKQRWSNEQRELRRRIRDLECHNEALATALSASEAATERLLDLIGVSVDGGVPQDWENQLQRIAEQAHKNALHQELQQAEQRLRSMLGATCWGRLSENARAALREGEWLFAAVEGEDRDYGASLLEYARGLERAFKDAIFNPSRTRWQGQPGSVERLQLEGNDPSLGPFVRYVLQGGHLTLGSMAATLDRMGDVRRQGVAVTLLRRELGIDPWDERALADWQRTAHRLALAADLRNRPAHAGSVNRQAVHDFRDLILGMEGLLRALETR